MNLWLMDKLENQEQIEEKLENLSGFEIWKIRDQTWIQLFDTIGDDEEKLKEFTDQFDDIYYLSVHPNDIDKYKDNPAISDILKHYKHTAEWRRLELMMFKIKEISEKEKQKILKELEEEYWLDIQLDESKYEYIVWYYWWSAWRTCSYYIDEIKKIYPVKTLK